MKNTTKNIISLILPVVTIFVIGFILKAQPTGLVVYENRTLYRLNGSVSINLEKGIHTDSYIRIKIDDDLLNVNLIEFLEKSGKGYRVSEGAVIGEGVYKVEISALGIIRGFEKGKHIIKTEIVYKGSILYSDEEITEI